MKKNESVRRHSIGWIDLLRVLACFLVVFSHCCDAFVGQFDTDRGAFLTGVFLGSLVRPCVPLFVMMTGVLLLPLRPDTRMTDFWSRRISRILVPLVVWSLMLPVAAFVYFHWVNPATHNPLLSVADYTSGSLVERLTTFVFNFNFDTVPLWYLYMLIGLYLFMPLLNAWLTQASRSDLQAVLGLWGITLVLPYIKMAAPLLGYQGNYGNMELLGGCDWNPYGTFYYFSGFMGYLILAYYLIKYPLQWSWRRVWIVCTPLFAVGYAITSWGYVLMQNYFPGNYAYLEIVWYFSGINVFMMTLPVFVIVQKWNVHPRAWLSRLASLSFGIYLCHYIFVFVCYDVFDYLMLPATVRIFSAAVTTFVLASAVTWMLSRNCWTRRAVS
ncbi:MAG: acyltransferase [Clostridium sp.]|nr:acyltransferase [Clostridium sp.]